MGVASKMPEHLAIFVEPYLTLILNGKKTMELRLSANRIAPYRKVRQGEKIWVKQSGGSIIAFFTAGKVRFYRLPSTDPFRVLKPFVSCLCIRDSAFWTAHSNAAYATLIELMNVTPIPPISFEKRDRRGWVILKKRITGVN